MWGTQRFVLEIFAGAIDFFMKKQYYTPTGACGALMTVKEIKEKLGAIDSGKGIPLYEQLRERLESYIDECAEGFFFPSEREIAGALGVNRRTVRKALEFFVDKGLLKRSVKGTVVSKKTDENNYFNNLHPFIFDSFPILNEKKTIRFTLYENYPSQKECWQKLAEIFNASNPFSKVELDYLPLSVSHSDGYFEYIKSSKPDIIQTAPLHNKSAKLNKLREPLPKDIKALLKSEDYWCSSIFENFENSLDSYIPLAFSMHILAWSRDLDIKRKVDVYKTLTKSGMKELFEKTGKSFSRDDLYLSGHIADYTMGSGFPMGKNEDDVRKCFLGKYKLVAELPEAAEHWFLNPLNTHTYQIFDSMKFFLENKTVFTGGFFLDLFNINKKFAYHAHLPQVEDDQKILTGVSGVAVNSESENKERAWDFARFLLSADAQMLFAGLMRAGAVRKECNYRHLGVIQGSEKSLDSAISRCKTFSKFEYELCFKLADFRAKFYMPLFKKQISVEDALEATVRELKKEKFI